MNNESLSTGNNLDQKEGKGYFQAFRESWEKTWEHKTLWFWGVLATSFSFSTDSFSPSREGMNEENLEMSREMLLQEISWLINWLKINFGWFLVGLAFMLLFWLISLLVRGGLMRFLAEGKKAMGWKKDGKAVWLEGKKSFFQLLKFDGYCFLFLAVLFLLFGSCLLGLFLWILLIEGSWADLILRSLAFLLLVGFSISLILFFLIKSLADFLVVLLEKRPLEAFWEGWKIIQGKFNEFIKLLGMLLLGLWLISLALEITVFLLGAFFSGIQLVFNLSLFPLDEMADFSSQNQAGNFSLGVLLFLLSLFFSGIFTVFQLDYKLWWLEKNRIIRPLKKKEEAKETVPEVLSAKELEATDLPLS